VGVKASKAFTLIEILVALAIIGIISMVVAPNFRRASPTQNRDTFISSLNGLVQFAWQQALQQRKVAQVTFDFKKSMVSIGLATDKKDQKGNIVFAPIAGAYLNTTLAWPDEYVVRQLFIEGFDEMSRYSGRQATAEIWFYIVPDGLAQSVIINMIDEKDLRDGKPNAIGLVLNPFMPQFVQYDEFQKP
jgi:prepilin-type N-terminal cleavage/methylation domain-containing protein